MAESKLKADQIVAGGIRLLQLLTAAPNQSVSIARACSALGVQASDLDRIVEIVSSLSDRSTGVRAIIDMDEKTISLGGDAARLVPLRLSINDAAVLRYVLASLNIDQSTRLRIQAALDDPSQLQTQMISLAEPARYGSFYQKLLEAIEDGVRLLMGYRSIDEKEPRVRTIDPYRLVSEESATYLDAWDVDQDAQRKYRLDRISSLEVTEESAIHHPFDRTDIQKSLEKSSIRALVRCNKSYLPLITWSGIMRTEDQDDETVVLEICLASKSWLFDQVLAAAGNLLILEPQELRTEFISYAERLILPEP